MNQPATDPLRTPLYDFHTAAGGRMVDFAGWAMPVVYTSILDEHQHTRTAAGLFDVSHMGRLHFSGKASDGSDVLAFLQHVVTRDLADLAAGRSRYGLVCNDAGGTMDDVIVARHADGHWSVVCNASNRIKLLAHIARLVAERFPGVTVDDRTRSTAMVAIQGPRAVEQLAKALPVDFTTLKRFGVVDGSAMFVPFTLYRSGYTGEDGAELVFPAKAAGTAAKMLAGNLGRPDATIRPAGLGARDTLRIEAALPLYGHELDESIDPLSAGLGWAVCLDKEFVGAEALRKIAADGPRRRLIGLTLDGKRIARQGATVLRNGTPVGVVSSGTFGPTVQESIAMAFVDAEAAGSSTLFSVDFRGSGVSASIAPLPFYKRPNRTS